MILEEGFEVHDQLNPKLWSEDNKLHTDVREKILQIVDAFKDYVQVPLEIIDICLIGSNASYNYTSTSDLDIHIITNYELVDANKEILELFYNSMRSKFEKDYDIKIKGLEVELFVEDVKTNAVSNGIFSVKDNQWIKFPKKLTNIVRYDIEDDVNMWIEKANQALKSEKKENISHVVSNIYLMRKNWLATDGEFSKGNQIFKELRDRGIISTLKDKVKELSAKELSLEALNENYINAINELNEDSVRNLLSKTRSSAKGNERYKNRIKSKIMNTPKQYNQIDMNKLFKDGILTVDVAVQGEHGDYTVRISFGGFLDILHDQVKKLNGAEVDLKSITKTLITGFNRGDVYIHCDCEDFQYRYSYWSTKHGINSGASETRPSNITNPDDDLGCGCKHVLLVLTNTAWILKSSTVIYNYIQYIKKHQEKLYQDVLYPAIYQKKYEEPSSDDLSDES